MVTYVCPHCRTWESFPRCQACGYLDSRASCEFVAPYEQCPQCGTDWYVIPEPPACLGCGHVFTPEDNALQIAYHERRRVERDIMAERNPGLSRQ